MATLTAKDIKTGYYYTNKRNEVLYIVSLTLLPGNPGLTNAQVELQYRILKNNTWSEIKKYKYDVDAVFAITEFQGTQNVLPPLPGGAGRLYSSAPAASSTLPSTSAPAKKVIPANAKSKVCTVCGGPTKIYVGLLGGDANFCPKCE